MLDNTAAYLLKCGRHGRLDVLFPVSTAPTQMLVEFKKKNSSGWLFQIVY